MIYVLLYFSSYMYSIIQNGISSQSKSVKVLGVTFIYPVANTPTCDTKVEAIKLRELKEPGVFGAEHTDYYFQFSTGETLRVLDDKTILRWSEDKKYSVTFCNGKVVDYKEVAENS